MSRDDDLADWTRGGDRLTYQHCLHCGRVFYFRRDFCPRCGVSVPPVRAATGLGTVYAATLVLRAPSDEFRAIAPYRIVLVDLDEGFRAMAHADPTLVIGDRARCQPRLIAGRMLPYFEKEPHVP